MTHLQVIDFLNRLDRLSALLARPRSISDLAAELGIAARTVTRDIHFLKELGAPIVLRIKPYLWRLSRPWSFWRAIRERAAGLN